MVIYGFDVLTITYLASMHTNLGIPTISGTVAIDNTTARFSSTRNGSLMISAATATTFTVATAQTKLLVGFSFKRSTTADIQIAQLTCYNGTTNLGTVTFSIGDQQRLQVNSGGIIQTHHRILQAGAWYRIELLVQSISGNPTTTIIINNESVGPTTIASYGSANNFTLALGTAASNTSNTIWYDDLVVDPSCTYFGDNKVETLMPTANSVAQFNHSGASTNWQAVSQVPPGADYNYSTSSTPINSYDLFVTAGLPTTAKTVAAIQWEILLSGSLNAEFNFCMNVNSNFYTASYAMTDIACTGSVVEYTFTSTTIPINSGGAWTVAGTNSGTFGYIQTR